MTPTPTLAVERRGTGARLVLVHGFTQTARSWRAIAEALAARFEVLAVDAPGHGDSADVDADLPTGAALLADAGGTATYVGYSMGGRLCLHLALDRPELVERLVVVSATAGIEDDAERAARIEADEALAQSIERDGVERFIDRWVAQPMFAGLAEQDLGDRRRNSSRGLASSLRLAGTGTQQPSWDRLHELTMPVLVMAGEHDTKFTALAERMARCIPGADLAVVADAGHSLHLERPEEFTRELTRWLALLAPGKS